MNIDLDEINKFFTNYKKKIMPRTVQDLVLAGTNLKFGELETTVIECSRLRVIAPKITKNISSSYDGHNILVLRNVQTAKCFVYGPESGRYLGQFTVES